MEEEIKIDWKKIQKEYNKACHKLGFGEYDTGKIYPIESCSWNIFLSARSMGKTTQFLLFGLIGYKYYGMITHYVRQVEDMIAPKLVRNLYDTITSLGYINLIFEGRYDGVEYKAGRYYLVKYGEDGAVTNRSDYICILMSTDNTLYYKSSYNCPFPSIIIYDEFLGKVMRYNEFVDFSQIISTVFRHHLWGRIFMLANTIDKYSQYFKELCISDDVLHCDFGDYFVKDVGNTHIYCEFIGERVTRKKHLFNEFIFGFAKGNARLTSITGECGTWDSFTYPHLPHFECKSEIIINNIYIRMDNKYLKCRVLKNDEIGYYMNIFIYNTVPDSEDRIILSVDNPINSNEFFKYHSVGKLFKYLYDKGSIFFADNESGLLYSNYNNLIKNY